MQISRPSSAQLSSSTLRLSQSVSDIYICVYVYIAHTHRLPYAVCRIPCLAAQIKSNSVEKLPPRALFSFISIVFGFFLFFGGHVNRFAFAYFVLQLAFVCFLHFIVF